MPAATPDDHEARLRKLEDIVARQDERNRNYEQLIHLVARQGEVLQKHATSIESIWGAIGQVKVRVGFLVAGVGIVAGIFNGTRAPDGVSTIVFRIASMSARWSSR